MQVDGGQLIQAAIAFEKADMLQFYISKGAKVDLPPDTVSKLYIDHDRKPEYRKSPFIIQAAAQGDVECYNTLLNNGCKAEGESGFIGFSRKRKNQIISNVVGAAAFNGSNKILKKILKESTKDINYLSTEKKDFNAIGSYQLEYTNYTPIMLAAAGGGQNLDCIKQLVTAKADLTRLDGVENNILHVAAYH
jgi:ankyrin repeat protein